MSGVKTGANVDINTLFEPRGSSTKRADVGVTDAGVDISNTYYSVSEGGTATAPSTGIQSNGADISTLFAEIGTVSTAPNVVCPANFVAHGANITPGSVTTVLECRSDGNVFAGRTPLQTDRGDWADNIVGIDGSLFEVRFVSVSGTVPAGADSVWRTLSSTRSCSLSRSTTVGITEGVVDMEVREIANTSNNDTVRVTIQAEIFTDL